MKRLICLIGVIALSGCGTLVPKQVEFFQDKVEKFPEPSPALREIQKQAVYRAMEVAAKTSEAANAENASTNVTVPAQETRVITEAVAVSMGPPLKPAVVSTPVLATKLETAVAKQDAKVEEFKQENNANAGKKIEGTGLVKIPYLWWIGGIIGVGLVVFFVGKLALTAFATANPVAAVGLNVVNAAQSVVTKGFAQLVKGGEDFKGWVEKEVQDAGLQEKILAAFRTTHKQAQDSDVQGTIRAMTA